MIKEFVLKVLTSKLHNIKHIIASRQIRNSEIFAFVAAVVFKLIEP